MPETNPDPRTRAIEEPGQTFPLLTIDEHELVEKACRARLLDHAIEIADVAELKGSERFESIAAAVPESVDLSHLYRFAYSSAGQRDIIGRSLEKAGVPQPDRAAVIRRYVGFDAYNLALSILGEQRRMRPSEIEAELHKRTLKSAGLKDTPDTDEGEGEDDDSPPGRGGDQ